MYFLGFLCFVFLYFKQGRNTPEVLYLQFPAPLVLLTAVRMQICAATVYPPMCKLQSANDVDGVLSTQLCSMLLC